MPYEPKTKPWAHQQEYFDRFKDAPFHACFFEQRCGKTKPMIDIAAYRYELPKSDPLHVDAMVVVALPSGVPANWATDEIPAHMPDRIPHKVLVWDAAKASTKAFQKAMEDLIAFPGLACLAVNGEAVITKNFERFLVRFLKKRRAFLAGDETTLIMKTPGAQRTRAMHAYGRMLTKGPGQPGVVVKSIMDGTPVGEGPFDLYSQLAFLSPKITGFTSFFAYKMRYGRWSKGYNGSTGQEYPVLEEYQNLEELQEKMRPYSMRVTRADAFPSMPPQLVVPVRFELSKEQRRVYDQLREEYEAQLRDGTEITAQHVLTRSLRLQQIASNMWPSEKAYSLCGECGGSGCEACDRVGAVEVETPAKPIDLKSNPRLECLEDQLTRTREPFIVWCRFTKDVDDALALLERMKISAVRYDGKVSKQGKLANKAAFQAKGGPLAMVGNPTSGGRGLTLKRARTVYNYSGFFSLLTYLQGNDRGEDTSLKVEDGDTGTVVANLLAIDTVDEDIDGAHQAKGSVADFMMARKAAGGRAFR